MVAKRGRHLIRAILFIVRLRNDVQNAHRRRTTRRRMGALAKTAAMLKQNGNDSKMKDRPPLTRCESSRRPRHELLRRQQQHRNSAPSTVYPAPRSPTPQPLNNYEEEEKEEGNNGEFESFVHMPLPYQQLQREIYPSKAHKYAVNSINGKTINLNEEEEFLENNKLEEEEEIKITGWLDSKELINLLEKIEIHKKGNEWQKLFPSTSITWDRNKRSKNGNINGGGGTAGLKQLFSAGAKLVKNIQRGLYLATIFYTDDGQILCTVDDCLPTICVDENCTTSNGLASEEFHWLMKLSFCWSQLKQLKNALLCCSTATANSSIRIRLLEAAVAMHNALGVKDIGKLYYIPLQPRPSTYILITVRLLLSKDVDVSLAAQGLALRWMRLGKFLIKKQNCSVMESLKFEILSILNFYESSLISLQPGLYLTYLRLQTSLNCINVLIPNNFTSILPFTKIRSNSYLTKQELDYLKLLSINQKEINSLSVEQINFHKELANAAKMLMNDLSLENPQISSTRIFFHRIVRLKKNVLLILAMPRPEEVCPIINLIKNKEDKNLNNSLNWANNNKNQFGNNGKCLSLPVSVFQIVNIFNYQPKLLCIYCQLSVFLDHFLMLSQYEQRANIDQNIAKEYSEQFLLLGQYQKLLEKCWQSTRWISDFASVARDKAFLNGRYWFPLPHIFNQLLINHDEEINNK